MPLAVVIIVGTSHPLQMASQELKATLQDLCCRFSVSAIGEEMSDDATQEYSSVVSVPVQVAKALRLPHRYCDPGRTERARLGIRQDNDICAQLSLSEDEIDTQLKESRAKRESYWLDQLLDLNIWPVLFVCGADHVDSFRRLLQREDIDVHVAAADWVL